jgi:DNA-binding HxlR family transcriptional regulator
MPELLKKIEEFEMCRKLTGKKWTLPVLFIIVKQPKKFNKLKQLLPGITPSILSKLLDHLEKNKLLYKKDDLYCITKVGEFIINRTSESMTELKALREKKTEL